MGKMRVCRIMYLDTHQLTRGNTHGASHIRILEILIWDTDSMLYKVQHTILTVNCLDCRPDPHTFCLGFALFSPTLNLRYRSDHTNQHSFDTEALRTSFPPALCDVHFLYTVHEVHVHHSLFFVILSLSYLNVCTKIQLPASAFSCSA